jgi:7,8-dihydroneopterin aldolase/epimerase/oxygenase
MNSILTISLTNLRFFAYHGLYEEEKKTGNQFDLELFVSYIPPSGTITDISDTINYVSLYELLKKEMQQPRGLLETLAMEIADKIHHDFPMIKRIELSVVKTQPPIAQFAGKVGVKYVKEFE